jgi:hypothetical protein
LNHKDLFFQSRPRSAERAETACRKVVGISKGNT